MLAHKNCVLVKVNVQSGRWTIYVHTMSYYYYVCNLRYRTNRDFLTPRAISIRESVVAAHVYTRLQFTARIVNQIWHKPIFQFLMVRIFFGVRQMASMRWIWSAFAAMASTWTTSSRSTTWTWPEHWKCCGTRASGGKRTAPTVRPTMMSGCFFLLESLDSYETYSLDLHETTISREYLMDGMYFEHGKDLDGKPLVIVPSRNHIRGARDSDVLCRVLIYWLERILRYIFMRLATWTSGLTNIAKYIQGKQLRQILADLRFEQLRIQSHRFGLHADVVESADQLLSEQCKPFDHLQHAVGDDR